MKNKYILPLFAILALQSAFAIAQDGDFKSLRFNDVTKRDGAAGFYGWGINMNQAFDVRPHQAEGQAFVFNHHSGLTFSAHSYYGGIRFYNQGYPSGPLDLSSGATMVMSITNNAVGIGTSTPQSILNIRKTDIGNDNITMVRNTDSPNLDFVSSYNGSDDLQSGSFGFGVRPSDDAWQIWSKKPSVGWENLFSVRLNGNVGVGITTPKEKLSVNGNIRAKEIKVEAANWPDYVFEEGYKVGTLEELESYIKTNKHLPNMPSAKEAENKGVELGNMVKQLLKNQEELTLHLIKIEKENTQLKKVCSQMKREINDIKTKK